MKINRNIQQSLFFERAGLKGNGKPKDLYTKTGGSKEEWLKKILAKTSTVQQRLIENIDFDQSNLNKLDLQKKPTVSFNNPEEKNKLTLDQTKCWWEIYGQDIDDERVNVLLLQLSLADLTKDHAQLINYVVDKKFGEMLLKAFEEKFKVKGQDMKFNTVEKDMKFNTPEEQELTNSKPRKKVEDSPVFKRVDEKREFESSEKMFFQTPKDLDKYIKCLQLAEDLVILGKKDIKQDPPAKFDDLLKFVEEKIKFPGNKEHCFSCGYKPGDELKESDKVKRSEKDKQQEAQEISEEKEQFKSESKKVVENFYGEEKQLSSKDIERVENLLIEEPTNPNHASYKDVDKYLAYKGKPFKKITPLSKDKPKEIDYKKAYYDLLDKINSLHKESYVFENSLLKENINKELSKEIEGKQESYNQFKESLALKHRCLSVIADYDKEHRIYCVDGFYSLTGLKAKIEGDWEWVIRDLEDKIVVILPIDDLLKHTGQSSLLFEKEFGEAFVDFIHTREAQKRSKFKKEEVKKFLNEDGSLNDPLDSVDRLSDDDIKDVIKKIEDTKARNKLYGKKTDTQKLSGLFKRVYEKREFTNGDYTKVFEDMALYVNPLFNKEGLKAEIELDHTGGFIDNSWVVTNKYNSVVVKFTLYYFQKYNIDLTIEEIKSKEFGDSLVKYIQNKK